MRHIGAGISATAAVSGRRDDEPRRPTPDRERERDWQALGYALVAGIDEVGRGPLAGPVLAAAVILPADDHPWLSCLRDSKELSAVRREALATAIRAGAVAWGLGRVEAERIDAIGIAPAAAEAMRLAVRALAQPPAALLIDAFFLNGVCLPQEAVIRGDARCSAIAAASIVAKVARDRLMRAYEEQYPGYGFVRNQGYGTAAHLAALARLGPSPIHRRSFAPLRLEGAG